MPDIWKVVNTVRYMTLRQWRYRLYYTARNRLIKRKVRHRKSNMIPQPLSLYYRNDLHRSESVICADNICKLQFNTVSDLIKKFDNQVDWDLSQEEYRLVCFKINSFRWLLDLSDAYKYTGNSAYIKKGFEFIDDWHQRNGTVISGDKWNPYVIAERIMNWIGFCSEYCVMQNKDISLYAGWIYEQARELNVSLEYHLAANHLLSEGKALLAAGVFLKDSGFYKSGKKLLDKEFKAQFLSDGGHYERSISYHVESLQQYFEALVILTICQDSEASDFAEMMKEPYRYLNGMIGVSGEIPLFNDAAYDYPFYNAADFLATSGMIYKSSPTNGKIGEYYRRWNITDFKKENIDWKARDLYESTGYMHHKIKVGKDEYSFFFDAGDGGPDSNLGHAHADALGILLSGLEKNILTDSGVFTYKPGLERDHCRATRAHNTIEIDGKNSAEIWGAFRVAKRGHSKILKYEQSKDFLHIRASHDGYGRCLKSQTVHIRDIVIAESQIIIRDSISGKYGHKAVSRFHIGPKCTVNQADSNTCDIDGCVRIKSDLSMRLAGCNIAEFFGQKEVSTCIEIPFDTSENKEITVTIQIMSKEK